MRSFYSAVAIATVALAATACGRTYNPAAREWHSPLGASDQGESDPRKVAVPESFKQKSTSTQAGFAPVSRGTIRLGEVDSASAIPEAPPSAVGGGPPAEAQTSVGPMSPTTVTGADSPLDNATTAAPIGNQPANPTTTGSAGAPAGPNSHGGVAGHPAGR